MKGPVLNVSVFSPFSLMLSAGDHFQKFCQYHWSRFWFTGIDIMKSCATVSLISLVLVSLKVDSYNFLSSLDTLQLLVREGTRVISLFEYIFNVVKFRIRSGSKLFIGIFLLQSLNLASLLYKCNFRS